jgi:RNA-directed DNA polymerase
MEAVLSRGNLKLAYDRVVSNRGSGGVDGVQVEDLAVYLQLHWGSILQSLRAGTYVPQAVLGVEIPKSNGGIRQLGIPTVVDRMIQQAIHQVLSRIWEPMFSDYS